MKVYFLRVTAADLTQQGSVRLSSTYDLYDNDTYRNYSVTKSTYGTGAPVTFIGLRGQSGDFLSREEVTEPEGTFITDSGIVEDGRFIDTSGRVDAVSYSVETFASVSLWVHASDQDDEEEWEKYGPFTTADEINNIDSGRYIKLEFEFDEFDPDFVAYVRVEIDRPLMGPIYRSTRKMLNEFPEWMELHDPLDHDPREVAETDSVGGGVLNSLSGEWLDDVRRELNYRDFQKNISTIDLNQMAWCWKANLIPHLVWDVQGDGIQLARAADFDEFRTASEEDVCYIDFNNRTIYVAQKYVELQINGDVYDLELHHVWNFLDELGLFVDLARLKGEDNDVYQARIYDVFKNRGGVGTESLKLALRRELNLWKVLGQEVDSDAEIDDNMVKILEMEDLERDPKYFAPDGMPTRAFVRLVERLALEYPTTWGRFRWDRAIWDVGGEDHSGFGIIPYRYDTAPPPDDMAQSGVGDGDDLYVLPPRFADDVEHFAARMKIRGRERVTRTEYPPVEFDCVLRGKGTTQEVQDPSVEVWLSLELGLAGGMTVVASFELAASSTESVFDFMGNGATLGNLTFRDMVTGEPFNGFAVPEDVPEYDGVVPLSLIESVTLKQGRWDGSYTDLAGNVYEAWFSVDLTSILQSGVSSISYVRDPEEDVIPEASIFLKHTLSPSPVNVPWTSDDYHFKIKINGVPPMLGPSPITMEVPDVFFPSTVSNPSLELELETTDSSLIGDGDTPAYGGLSYNDEDETIFIPSSLIQANGNSSWTNGKKTFATSLETITFSTTTSATYPLTFSVWDLFEREQLIPFSGTVDENGPWRHGRPGSGDSNLLSVRNLTRESFGINRSDNYIVTWMGVESDNPDVVVWLDSNAVRPVNDSSLDYPEAAIVEVDDGQTYRYESVAVRAKLRPRDQSWRPRVHGGYFYDKNDEYYFYIDKKTVTTSQGFVALPSVPRQGAPIIVTNANGDQLRQVAFFNMEDSDAQLSITNREVVSGTGERHLYLAYDDVYAVEVYDESGVLEPSASEASTNVLTTTFVMDKEKQYTVVYKLRNSFYVDYEHVSPNGVQEALVVFDAPRSYTITYEGSALETDAVVDVPLNPLFTVQNEGFLFISHKEYSLDSLSVYLSPSRILADGVDYIMITMQSLDEHGNSKPNQQFSLSTTFGTLDKTSVTTDHDGFAVVILSSADVYTTGNGTLTITGGVNASINFEIEEAATPRPRLYGAVTSEQVQADGKSITLAMAYVEGVNHQPVPGVTIYWKKARSIYDLFTGNEVASGTGFNNTSSKGLAVANMAFAANSEDAGYWFVSLEATVNGVTIGDVVFWYEYPVSILGVENPEGLPQQAMQMQIPTGTIPEYADGVKYPVSYDETAPLPPEGNPTINWQPPSWYAIDAYQQWQTGISGNSVSNPT